MTSTPPHTPEARGSVRTRSVCPVCLASIPARLETECDATRLVKACPEHGQFKTVIWRGEPAFAGWTRPKIPSPPARPHTAVDKGCPMDCGLCPEHGQRTCTVLVEVTERCNLGCPVCFARSGEAPAPDPPLAEVSDLLTMAFELAGPCNLQISGGEPTVRDDLPHIVSVARAAGFSLVQLNTNGLRLADEPGYAKRLRRAGLDSAFLQFDGHDDANERLRGRPLYRTKLAAIEALIEAGVGVVLVPTVRPGVNDGQLGDILRLAASLSPGVRGVHFQPVSYFGRYPEPPSDADRITLPEIMRALEKQTGGMVRADRFTPPGCEHHLCSFSAKYLVRKDGSLHPLTPRREACSCRAPEPAAEGAARATAEVARQWAAPPKDSRPAEKTGPFAELDAFLERARSHALSVSGMAFQDAWTLDLERLRGCCIHVADARRGLVPFCAYNLTSASGRPLYRGVP